MQLYTLPSSGCFSRSCSLRLGRRNLSACFGINHRHVCQVGREHVQWSAKLHVEYQHIAQWLHLDIPTLRLWESDFARPHLLVTDLDGWFHNVGVLLPSIISALFPLFMDCCGSMLSMPDPNYATEEALTAERQERLLRNQRL